MINPTVSNKYRFFRKVSGYSVKSCYDLAIAELWAESLGLDFKWEYDDIGYDALGDHEYWCKQERLEKSGYDQYGDQVNPESRLAYYRRNYSHDHEILYCLVKNDQTGDTASLGGIIDPSRDYRRLVEAELASELKAESDKRLGAWIA